MTAALVPSRSFPVSPAQGELIVVGHFALRQAIPTAVGPARAATVHGEPPRPRLVHAAVTPEVAEPPRATPHWMHPGPHVPTVLPTEEYLALRTATAKHRANAYAAMM